MGPIGDVTHIEKGYVTREDGRRTWHPEYFTAAVPNFLREEPAHHALYENSTGVKQPDVVYLNMYCSHDLQRKKKSHVWIENRTMFVDVLTYDETLEEQGQKEPSIFSLYRQFLPHSQQMTMAGSRPLRHEPDWPSAFVQSDRSNTAQSSRAQSSRDVRVLQTVDEEPADGAPELTDGTEDSEPEEEVTVDTDSDLAQELLYPGSGDPASPSDLEMVRENVDNFVENSPTREVPVPASRYTAQVRAQYHWSNFSRPRSESPPAPPDGPSAAGVVLGGVLLKDPRRWREASAQAAVDAAERQDDAYHAMRRLGATLKHLWRMKEQTRPSFSHPDFDSVRVETERLKQDYVQCVRRCSEHATQMGYNRPSYHEFEDAELQRDPEGALVQMSSIYVSIFGHTPGTPGTGGAMAGLNSPSLEERTRQPPVPLPNTNPPGVWPGSPAQKDEDAKSEVSVKDEVKDEEVKQEEAQMPPLAASDAPDEISVHDSISDGEFDHASWSDADGPELPERLRSPNAQQICIPCFTPGFEASNHWFEVTLESRGLERQINENGMPPVLARAVAKKLLIKEAWSGLATIGFQKV